MNPQTNNKDIVESNTSPDFIKQFSEALDKMYNQGIDHCLRILSEEVTFNPPVRDYYLTVLKRINALKPATVKDSIEPK